MRSRIIYIVLVTLFRISCSLALEVKDPPAIKNELKKAGFENIVVFSGADTVYVCAENRLYRWAPRAMSQMISSIMPLLPEGSVLHFTLLQQGIAWMNLTWSKESWFRQQKDPEVTETQGNGLQVNIDVPPDIRKEFRRNFFNSSFNKLDFVIYPQVKIQLGNFDDPFKSQFNIAPALEMTLLRGLNFMAQVIIPLQNDLEPNGSKIRPGIVALSQHVRLPANIFGLVSVGYFTRNRYGFNGEIRKFFLNGKISAGLTGGFTGYAEMVDGQWNYTPIDRLTFFADATYRWDRYDLTLKAGAGLFLNNDPGWRIDAYRQFREVTIGFFAGNNEGFFNGGFYFSIPLPPGRYSTRHAVRIRSESYFSWEYRARGMSQFGRTFSAGYTLSDMFHNIQPSYLKENMIREWNEKGQQKEKK